MNVLLAVDPMGEVTRLGFEARIALQNGDTASCARHYRQAAEMIGSAVSGLKRPSERDLARFLAATHYYHGGQYEEAAKVCEEIRESRLPARSRHLYPPFLEQVKERSAPGYAARYRDRIDGAFGRAVKAGDRSAAQEVIEILKDHQYLIPQDQMAYVRARCLEILGRQRAASLFYRASWRFNPDEPNHLSHYLDSLCKEGRHAEARAIVEEEVATHPGLQSSVNALHVMYASLTRNRQPDRVAEEQETGRWRIDLLKHFEAALEGYRALTPADRTKNAPWLDYACMIAFMVYDESKDAGKQLETLNRWIELRLDSPHPRVLRGMMTYPGAAARSDLREAIRLQSPDPLPYYFLAHDAIQSRDYSECDYLCTQALKRNPEPEIRAALLSWKALARWNLGLKGSGIRELFDEARRLRPDDSLIATYAQAFDQDQRIPNVPSGIPFDGEAYLREQAEHYVDRFSRRDIEAMSPILDVSLV
jgi:tetratricopeptide (TPR) repeat protein